jgi:hypothetical protein
MYESTRLERKTSEKNYSPVRDLNPEPPEFKSGAHLTRPPQQVNLREEKCHVRYYRESRKHKKK